MKLTKLIIILLLSVFVSSCYIYHKSTKDKLVYCYNGEYTGIDTLIDINGSYDIVIRSSSNQLSLLFFNDGIFAFDLTSELLYNENNSENKDLWWNAFSWGSYIIQNDTIIGNVLSVSSNTSSCSTIKLKIIDKNTIKIIFWGRDSINEYLAYNKSFSKFTPYNFKISNSGNAIIKKKKWFWCNKNDWKQFMDSVKQNN